MEWVDNLLNQLPNRADTVQWLQNQLTLPTKEQFLADRNRMWGNTPQERMMNYTNMVAGFAGKAPQLLDRALPSALSIALHPDELAAQTRYQAAQAANKRVNDEIDAMYRAQPKPTYKTYDDVVQEHEALQPPAGPPKLEPEVQPKPSEPIQQGWQQVETGGEAPQPGDLTSTEYEAKRRAGNPSYDAVFFSPKSGIDRTGRYAGVYYNENLPEVLDEIERHQMGRTVAPEDLHGGTLADAVGKRIGANLNGDFTHYYTAPEGHQVGVNLTGNVHDGLGLTEIITGDGLRGWMPSERLTQIQAPDAPQ